MIELPEDGVITRRVFESLPEPGARWVWELRDGRLMLTHLPVTVWHWQIISLVLEYWQRLGHVVAGEQYVAHSTFARGGPGRNNLHTDGVVFVHGHRPKQNDSIHDAADILTAVAVVTNRREENDAATRFETYAALGIPQYWIVRGGAGDEQIDGLVTMYELRDGTYEVAGHRFVSRLG